MIAESLKVQAHDDTRDPRVINTLLALSYWSLKECSLGSWIKPVLREGEKKREQRASV